MQEQTVNYQMKCLKVDLYHGLLVRVLEINIGTNFICLLTTLLTVILSSIVP